MNFQNFNFLFLLSAVLLLAATWLAAWFGARRRRRLLALYAAPEMLPKLVKDVSPAKRRLKNWLFGLGLALVMLAAARPWWGRKLVQYPEQTRDILLAIDTSRSMLATDAAPSRLKHAKWMLRQLIADRPGDRFGIIVFAGEAFLECPLTRDSHTLFTFLDDIDTRTVPLGGTNIGSALATAREAFEGAEGANRAVVLVTDGDELQGNAAEQISQFREAGIPLVIAGIGDPNQAVPVQLPDGDYLRDQQGGMVSTRLNETMLRQLARRTDGLYVHSTTVSPELESIVGRLDRLIPEQIEEGETMRPIERYQLPLAAGVLLLLARLFLGDRKRTANTVVQSAMALAIFSVPISIDAADSPTPYDHIIPSNNEKNLSLPEGAREKAPQFRSAPQTSQDSQPSSTLSEDEKAEIKAEISKMQDKAEQSTGLSRARALYNMGAAYQHLGKLEKAREAYNEALDFSASESLVYAWALWNLGILKHHEAQQTMWTDPQSAEDDLNRAKYFYQEALRSRQLMNRADPYLGETLSKNLELALNDQALALTLQQFTERYKELLSQARELVAGALASQEKVLKAENSAPQQALSEKALGRTRQTYAAINEIIEHASSVPRQFLVGQELMEEVKRIAQAEIEAEKAMQTQGQSPWQVWNEETRRELQEKTWQYLQKTAALLGNPASQESQKPQDPEDESGDEPKPDTSPETPNGAEPDEARPDSNDDKQEGMGGEDLEGAERPVSPDAEDLPQSIEEEHARSLLRQMLEQEGNYRDAFREYRSRQKNGKVEKDW